MNANTFVITQPSDQRRIRGAVSDIPLSDAGYNIGGPVYIPGNFNRNREKLFFFLSQEWNQPTHAGRAATDHPSHRAQRTGNFSKPRNAAGNFGLIYDPLTRPRPTLKARLSRAISSPLPASVQYGPAMLELAAVAEHHGTAAVQLPIASRQQLAVLRSGLPRGLQPQRQMARLRARSGQQPDAEQSPTEERTPAIIWRCRHAPRPPTAGRSRPISSRSSAPR